MTKYLLFDLDSTLYSCRWGLEDNNKIRMQEFSGAFLGISPEEAWQERLASGKKYGTNLEWLMGEKGFTDVEAYLSAIHPEGEADNLPPDPELRALLESIPLPKAILTNSHMEHVKLILDKLGFNGLFTHIFDIRYSGFKGKPHHSAYKKALDALGVNAADVLFIDDNPRYAEGFITMGGRSLLLDEKDSFVDYPHPKIRDIKEFIQYI